MCKTWCWREKLHLHEQWKHDCETIKFYTYWCCCRVVFYHVLMSCPKVHMVLSLSCCWYWDSEKNWAVAWAMCQLCTWFIQAKVQAASLRPFTSFQLVVTKSQRFLFTFAFWAIPLNEGVNNLNIIFPFLNTLEGLKKHHCFLTFTVIQKPIQLLWTKVETREKEGFLTNSFTVLNLDGFFNPINVLQLNQSIVFLLYPAFLIFALSHFALSSYIPWHSQDLAIEESAPS